MTRMLATLLMLFLLGGCTMLGPKRGEIPLASNVDLPRFMGDWYVIGFIPIFPERDAHNPVESYRLNADGTIATTYRYRDGSFDKKLTKNTPKGFVVPNTNNALWGMQFLWPFKGEYRIAYVEPDYSVTIVARNKRDYVWLLARRPEMDDRAYARYRELIAAMGYDMSEFTRTPQQWPEKEPRPPL